MVGIASGTAGAASTTTKIADTTQSWPANKWKGFEVVISPGQPGCAVTAQQKRWITANTTQELQWAPPLPASPASCAYKVTGGGMVVIRGSFSAQISNFQWDNAAPHTLFEVDQLVLVDVLNASVLGNIFSLIHFAGHNAVRFVSTGTGGFPVSGPISLENNTVLNQCTAPECVGKYVCFLFDRQQASGGFQDVLISGNNLGSPPTSCVPVDIFVSPAYGKIADDNLGF